ncbi:energy-coupling factor transporter transmembrane protein EcfT [uncultured Enorma sp.]|uniref:energy-coupling factor transporter transmembrane component T family protein n=1 Tax=uncultured Enorma sp. TaxID=1714346 RepID=UPI002594AD99|nr:energy-coupling factor transporter transmembrane protein EcfT [uncultured Enorma sp.]
MSARISIGRYYSAASPIHALDPRVKIAATIGYMVSCLIVTNALELVLAGAFVLAAVALARVPVSRLLAQLKPVMFFLVVTSLFNLLFVGTGTELVALGVLRITTGGVQAAALYTLRFLFLLLMGSLLMLTTQPMALTDAAERLLAPLARLGVPVSEGMLVLSIALRFVPILGEDARAIANAQIARGAKLEGARFRDRIHAFIPLAVPLFSAAVRHADRLACAMEARCYTGGAGRTHYHELRLAPRDAVAIAVFALYLVVLIAL